MVLYKHNITIRPSAKNTPYQAAGRCSAARVARKQVRKSEVRRGSAENMVLIKINQQQMACFEADATHDTQSPALCLIYF